MKKQKEILLDFKEPKGVDFIIESKPLTDEERKKISEFIQKDKEKLAKSADESKSKTV